MLLNLEWTIWCKFDFIKYEAYLMLLHIEQYIYSLQFRRYRKMFSILSQLIRTHPCMHTHTSIYISKYIHTVFELLWQICVSNHGSTHLDNIWFYIIPKIHFSYWNQSHRREIKSILKISPYILIHNREGNSHVLLFLSSNVDSHRRACNNLVIDIIFLIYF